METADDERRVVVYSSERLDEWARWQRSERDHRLGFPAAASFARRAERPGEAGDPDIARAREVERVLCRLSQLRPVLYRVLALFYVGGHGAARCAELLAIDRREFYRLKREGEAFVAGALLAGVFVQGVRTEPLDY